LLSITSGGEWINCHCHPIKVSWFNFLSWKYCTNLACSCKTGKIYGDLAWLSRYDWEIQVVIYVQSSKVRLSRYHSLVCILSSIFLIHADQCWIFLFEFLHLFLSLFKNVMVYIWLAWSYQVPLYFFYFFL
jgi:hypothetical protein